MCGCFLYSGARHAQLFTLTMLLFLSSSQMKNSAECSRHLVEVSESSTKEGEGKEMMVEGAMLGSRPPSCLGRCSTCGHCEAVQMPLVPSKKEKRMVKYSYARINSRGDEYSSNYKPMNWKCKCGDMILNP